MRVLDVGRHGGGARVQRLLDEFPTLRVYLDDAHGFGWQGRHGKGQVLHHMALHPRMIVAVSLAKSSGSGGSALVFPDPDEARRVPDVCRDVHFFRAAASSGARSGDRIRRHPSVERARESSGSAQRTDRSVRALAIEYGVSFVSSDHSPIWFVRAGGTRQAIELAGRLIDDGFYLNVSFFPRCRLDRGGVRLTNTLYHSDSQLEEMMHHLGRNLQVVRSAPHVVDLTAMESAAETG